MDTDFEFTIFTTVSNDVASHEAFGSPLQSEVKEGTFSEGVAFGYDGSGRWPERSLSNSIN